MDNAVKIDSLQAEKIAKLNVNMEITADANYKASEVEKLIKIVKDKNLQIKIHATNYSSATIEKFAKIGGANITIIV